MVLSRAGHSLQAKAGEGLALRLCRRLSVSSKRSRVKREGLQPTGFQAFLQQGLDLDKSHFANDENSRKHRT